MNRTVELAAAAFVAAAGVYLGAEAVTAAAWTAPAYSYRQNWISDLGASSSPLHALMNAAFIVRGVLFALGATLAASSLRRTGTSVFVAFATVHAIGGMLIGLVPEDVPPPIGMLHLAGALLAIGGGNLALIAGGGALRAVMPGWYRPLSSMLGAAGLAALLALNVVAGNPPHGVVERVSVYTINAWELMTAALLRRPRPHRAP
jgi:hypothetical membrane protein